MAQGDLSNSKKTRAKGPRSKTGCLTCKARHKKCDEEKPRCQKCSNGGWKCEYATIIPLDSRRRPLQTLAPEGGKSQVYLAPSKKQFENEEERLYFQIFCGKTAVELSGAFDSDIWNYLILQACETDPPIKYAAIAIGALHPSASTTSLKSSQTSEYAFTSYQKSISFLRNALSTTSVTLRSRLISCLLYLHFELLSGSSDTAVQLAYNGIEMIEEFFKPPYQEKDHLTSLFSPDPLRVEHELIQMFGRLELHSMSYIDRRSRALHRSHRFCGQVSIDAMPAEFKSFKEARIWYELILRRSGHWIASLDLDQPQDETLFSELTYIVLEFNKWNAAMGSLWTWANTPDGKSSLPLASAMRVHYLAGYLATTTVLGERRASYSHYDAECMEILALSRYVLSAPPSHNGMSWDTQIITHLGVVARLFRNRKLRRELIHLLASTLRRKEGVWDSWVLAKAQEWMYGLEEKGLGDDVLYVPEMRLVRHVRFVNNAEKRETRIKCEQPMKYRSEETTNRKLVVKWDM